MVGTTMKFDSALEARPQRHRGRIAGLIAGGLFLLGSVATVGAACPITGEIDAPASGVASR